MRSTVARRTFRITMTRIGRGRRQRQRLHRLRSMITEKVRMTTATCTTRVFEIPCPKYRPSLLKGGASYRRPHMQCPSLMEEEYLDEG